MTSLARALWIVLMTGAILATFALSAYAVSSVLAANERTNERLAEQSVENCRGQNELRAAISHILDESLRLGRVAVARGERSQESLDRTAEAVERVKATLLASKPCKIEGYSLGAS